MPSGSGLGGLRTCLSHRLTLLQAKATFTVMIHSRIRILKNHRISLGILDNKRIAVIGFGSQGKAQALNLRDSGFTPIIGLRPSSRSRKAAVAEGFRVVDIDVAVRSADLIAVMIPDHLHGELFRRYIYGNIRPGQSFIFAHGLSVHFGLVERPRGIRFLLVAPHAPGIRLRENYLIGKGVPAFIAAVVNSSAALKLAAAYGKAIGCARAGLIVTTFENEAIGDIFGEQAVLCGGLAGLLRGGFDTLVDSGMPPQNAYLECVYQLDLIVDLIKRFGIEGMYRRISVTARRGSRHAENIVINRQSLAGMSKLLRRIKSGEFVKELLKTAGGSNGSIRKKSRTDLLDRTALMFSRMFDT